MLFKTILTVNECLKEKEKKNCNYLLFPEPHGTKERLLT